jgi:predicted nucleic acid-binding protein
MFASALVDTGPLVAFLDKRDRWHSACHDTFRQIPLPLLTSEAVLAELFYFVRARSYDARAAWKFVRSGTLQLASITDSDLPALSQLMHQYRDRPMDFADATLVHLAQRESLNTILTIDIADFETYRIGGTKRFRIIPGRIPLK